VRRGRPRTDEIETNGEPEPEQLMASASSAAHAGSRKGAREEDKGRRDISRAYADSDPCGVRAGVSREQI
jgi:hypothetical protein